MNFNELLETIEAVNARLRTLSAKDITTLQSEDVVNHAATVVATRQEEMLWTMVRRQAEYMLKEDLIAHGGDMKDAIIEVRAEVTDAVLNGCDDKWSGGPTSGANFTNRVAHDAKLTWLRDRRVKNV